MPIAAYISRWGGMLGTGRTLECWCSTPVLTREDLDRTYGYNAPRRIIEERIPLAELTAPARSGFGDMIKAVVDVERGVMAVAGELHADVDDPEIRSPSWRSSGGDRWRENGSERKLDGASKGVR